MDKGVTILLFEMLKSFDVYSLNLGDASYLFYHPQFQSNFSVKWRRGWSTLFGNRIIF